MKAIERLRRPDDAAALERGRVPIVGKLARPAVEHAVQARPDAVHAPLQRMAGDAFLVELLAASGIPFGARRAGRHDERECEGQPSCAQCVAHHAGTSGPGFFT